MAAEKEQNGVGFLEGQWFNEVNDLWYGQAFSLKSKEVLYHQRSAFQDIMVFQSEAYGKVLVLDGIIQCTERDEFSYQEMISHLPMFSHPCPKSVSAFVCARPEKCGGSDQLVLCVHSLPYPQVLVVGGGDGGVLREVAKHSMVEEIHHCEIDKEVIEVSKKYLPSMAIGFDNPKVKLHTMDGSEFLRTNKNTFDVIITDSSDPIGPAKSLFKKTYFERVSEALKPGGIMCMQAECLWFSLDLIKTVMDDCRLLYPVTSYALTTTPSYPCGQIGFVLASKDENMLFDNPKRTITSEEAEKYCFQYYDSDVHSASFILPRFAKKVLKT